jgi:hypothetical protein
MARPAWNVRTERVIEALRASITHGGQALADIPPLVRDIIERDLWRRRPTNYRETAPQTFTAWADFVRAEPPAGLGQDPIYVAKLCRGHADAEAALARVSRGRGKPQTKHDNIMNNGLAAQGTARAYALRRLKRSRPDLLAQVLTGKLSPHGAMIKAGFRHRMITVRSDDLHGALRQLVARYGLHAVQRALTRLQAASRPRRLS